MLMLSKSINASGAGFDMSQKYTNIIYDETPFFKYLHELEKFPDDFILKKNYLTDSCGLSSHLSGYIISKANNLYDSVKSFVPVVVISSKKVTWVRSKIKIEIKQAVGKEMNSWLNLVGARNVDCTAVSIRKGHISEYLYDTLFVPFSMRDVSFYGFARDLVYTTANFIHNPRESFEFLPFQTSFDPLIVKHYHKRLPSSIKKHKRTVCDQKDKKSKKYKKYKTEDIEMNQVPIATDKYGRIHIKSLATAKKEVFLYNGTIQCSRYHPSAVQSVNILCDCLNPPYYCVFTALWCKNCDKYFIYYASFMRNNQIYNLLPISFKKDPSLNDCGFTDEQIGALFDDAPVKDYYGSWKEKSRLAELGYSTTLSQSQRRNVLAYIIDSRLMRKSEIISWLNFLIQTRWRKEPETSIRKEDLYFVEHYKIQEQGEPIPGVIVKK